MVAEKWLSQTNAMGQVVGSVSGWVRCVGVTFQKVMSLCWPILQAKTSRFSVGLKFQDEPSVAK